MALVRNNALRALFRPQPLETAYRIMAAKKTVALVAHDNMKRDLIDWASFNRDSLAQFDLVATGTTGKLLEDALNLPVVALQSGPLGGDLQIGSRISATVDRSGSSLGDSMRITLLLLSNTS